MRPIHATRICLGGFSMLLLACGFLAIPQAARAQSSAGRPQWTCEQVIEETMHPFQGDSVKGVDCSTLAGKVLCGYQGWHAAEGDDCGRGWYHWQGRHGFKPGSTNVDLWPDVSELSPAERYATAFKTAEGKTAEVYIAFNAKTVIRHFQWMRDYGIDGVFVQRFAGEVFHPLGLRQFNTVLDHCREGANKYGRTYAVMYDLSAFVLAGDMSRVMDDWKLLVEKMRITSDPAYCTIVASRSWPCGDLVQRRTQIHAQRRPGSGLILEKHTGRRMHRDAGRADLLCTLDRDTVNDKLLSN